MSIKNPDKSRALRVPSGLFPLVNLLTAVLGVLALFFLFTGAIPFAQWGWAADVSKGLSVKFMRVSFSLFIASLTSFYLFPAEQKNRFWINRIFQGWMRSPLKPAVILVYILYCAILCIVNLKRHEVFGTRAFDLGIFNQAVWNTLHGDFLYSSLKGGICLLGDHVSPLLALIAPVYAFWQKPEMLIVFQVLVSALNLFFIARIAKEKLNDPFAVWVVVLIYFFYAPTRNALHEDFHPEKLVEPLIFMAFMFIEKKRVLPFLLCLPVIASAKENMLGITFILGFYAAVFKKERMTGALVMAVSVIVFWLEIHWFVPWLTGKPYFYGGVYTDIASPLAFAGRLFSVDSLEYMAKIFGPFLFLQLFHPAVLILTFPVLFQNLLAANPLARSIGYHYTIGMTPFIFTGAIYGGAVICEKFPFMKNKKAGLGAVLLFMGIMQSGPSEYYSWWQMQKIHNREEAHFNEIRPKLTAIPARFSVLTHNNFVPPISGRKYVYMFEYSGLKMKADQVRELQPDYVIFDRRYWEGFTPIEAFPASLHSLGYVPDWESDGFSIYKKALSVNAKSESGHSRNL